MKLGKYDVTPKNVMHFLQGTGKKFLDDLDIKKLPPHEKEQVFYRMSKCSDCAELGKCKSCGCTTPDLFYAPNKTDSLYKWGPFLSEVGWNNFKELEFRLKLVVTQSNSQWLVDSGLSIKNATAIWYVWDPIKGLENGQSFVLDMEQSHKEIISSLMQWLKKMKDTWDVNANVTTKLNYKDNELDLGILEKGNIYTADFDIPNTTVKPLRIERVLPGCGCTSSYFSKDAAIPTDTLRVSLKLDTNKTSGKVRKSARVIFDNALPITLYISAEII